MPECSLVPRSPGLGGVSIPLLQVMPFKLSNRPRSICMGHVSIVSPQTTVNRPGPWRPGRLPLPLPLHFEWGHGTVAPWSTDRATNMAVGSVARRMVDCGHETEPAAFEFYVSY